MAELSDLERRIAQALDRIGVGVEKLGQAAATPPVAEEPEVTSTVSSGDAAELEAVREALDAERTANAQLEERVKAIKRRQEEQVSGLQAELEQVKAEAHAATRQLQRRLDDARRVLSSLLEASADGVTEPHLINQAMMAELEGLRAMRDADREELDTLLAAIAPLTGEAHHA